MSRERVDQLLDEDQLEYDDIYVELGLNSLPADLLGLKWRHVLLGLLLLPWLAFKERRRRA